jgi:hypothetical protein
VIRQIKTDEEFHTKNTKKEKNTKERKEGVVVRNLSVKLTHGLLTATLFFPFFLRVFVSFVLFV